MTGHPDDQSYANWRGPDFAATNTFALSAANPFSAASYVTNFASFVLFVIPTNIEGATVVVNFYTDNTETVSLGGFSWILPANATLHVIVPALGNFIHVHITTTAVVAQSAFIAVYPTNTPVQSPRYQGVANHAINGNLSVPASTTLSEPLPYVSQGRGYAWISDPSASAKIQASVKTLKLDGTVAATLVQWNTVGSFQAQEFVAPAVPLAFNIQNTDAAAAHAVDFLLVVDGR